MHPKIWGPPLWTSLLHIVLNYPEEPTTNDKNNASNFFQALGPMLPCNICQKNYKKHLHDKPVALDNRSQLLDWLVDLHNKSNPKSTLDLNQYVNRYSVDCASMIKNTNKSKSKDKPKDKPKDKSKIKNVRPAPARRR